MTHIAFQGKGTRVLAADDLAKAGVEGFKKTEFSRHEAVEVSDEVAEAITFDPELFGKFEVVDAPEEETVDKKKTDKKEEEIVSDSEPAAKANVTKTTSKP